MVPPIQELGFVVSRSQPRGSYPRQPYSIEGLGSSNSRFMNWARAQVDADVFVMAFATSPILSTSQNPFFCIAGGVGATSCRIGSTGPNPCPGLIVRLCNRRV